MSDTQAVAILIVVALGLMLALALWSGHRVWRQAEEMLLRRAERQRGEPALTVSWPHGAEVRVSAFADETEVWLSFPPEKAITALRDAATWIEEARASRAAGVCAAEDAKCPRHRPGKHCECWWELDGPCCECGHDPATLANVEEDDDAE